MTHPDDRKEFQASIIRQSLALGQDDAVFRQSTELVTELDRYDYTYLLNFHPCPNRIPSIL
jgi:hypothetical protein